MIRVKICGVTSVADALVAAEAGADAIGINFAPASPRRVTIETAAAVAAALPRRICRVGVFVDTSRDAVATIVRQVGLDAVQFHGAEEPAYCEGWPAKVVKAVRVRDAESLRAAAAYRVDFILADAYVEGRVGGTGERVPLAWLDGVPRERLILAGGLNADNVADAIRQVRPVAVDVASGVESAPGIKDAEKVRRFIANARAA
jgi:phosphoribosylanthranilate isomerase